MRLIKKIYPSKEAALQAGGKEGDITVVNGVVYCSCSCDSTQKEDKVVRTTKEFKMGKKNSTKELINNKTTDNGDI